MIHLITVMTVLLQPGTSSLVSPLLPPPSCPAVETVVESWQCPHPWLLSDCPGSLAVRDRWGWITRLEEDDLWDDDRRRSLVNIRLESWEQPDLVPVITEEGFSRRTVPG